MSTFIQQLFPADPVRDLQVCFSESSGATDGIMPSGRLRLHTSGNYFWGPLLQAQKPRVVAAHNCGVVFELVNC